MVYLVMASRLPFAVETQRIRLNAGDLALAKQLAAHRTKLQEHGNDVSLRATAHRQQRAANNFMGQITEMAFSAWLYEQDISFSARCFTITYRRQGSGVQPPFVDYLLPGNLKCDLKADRFDVCRIGGLLPVEKFLEKVRTDLVVWAECREGADGTVLLHGWNSWEDLVHLKDEPDAVQPNGRPLPKRAKRVPSSMWRDMRDLAQMLQALEPTNSAAELL